MNKKQLITAWTTGVIVSIVALTANYIEEGVARPFFTIKDLLRFGLPVLIIGGLLIYTLRDKKK